MENKACIEILQNEAYQGGECYYIPNNCRTLIRSLGWEVHLVHCHREGNKVADKLANLGVVQEERVLYFDVRPHEITSLSHKDNMGVTTPRFIA